MRERCGDLPQEECEARVEEAKRLTMQAGVTPDRVLPGTGAEHWLDCGQDRLGFKPAYSFRPRGSVQYALALQGDSKADGAEPLRFRFGLIGSSDTHSARPATGYKQTGPLIGHTDARAPRNAFYRGLLLDRGEAEDPQRAQAAGQESASVLLAERMTSFLYPGGTVAVHADGRDRDAIWQALERREVYGTSGPRIQLWFDLLDGEARRPMGSARALETNPRFVVRALGAFVQQPGCPQRALDALGDERVRSLCQDECYHPGDERHPIAAIEVVRIRPQQHPDESLTALIEDPWLSLPCGGDPGGCSVRFEDPDFVRSGRDTVYYVRALQAPTPAINGANLRTRFSGGRAVSVDPCRPGAEDGCLADGQERAWSSPIFVDQARGAARR